MNLLLVYPPITRFERYSSAIGASGGQQIPLGIYYLASYDSVHDISWWVNTGLDRMLFPGLLLLWVGGISMVKLFYDDE